MNKLYVEISGGYNDKSREYEISDELAELLKQWAHRDEQADDEKASNEVELDLSSEELGDLLSNSDGVSQQVRQELNSIFGNAESEAYELAIASFLSSNPPTEFFFEESMPEDIKAGLFTPSVSFEQFKEDWEVLNEDYVEDYDEDYDEEYEDEYAREDYNDMISDEYQEWVETLKPTERAARYGLEYDAPISEHYYRFVRIVKDGSAVVESPLNHHQI